MSFLVGGVLPRALLGGSNGPRSHGIGEKEDFCMVEGSNIHEIKLTMIHLTNASQSILRTLHIYSLILINARSILVVLLDHSDKNIKQAITNSPD